MTDLSGMSIKDIFMAEVCQKSQAAPQAAVIIKTKLQIPPFKKKKIIFTSATIFLYYM